MKEMGGIAWQHCDVAFLRVVHHADRAFSTPFVDLWVKGATDKALSHSVGDVFTHLTTIFLWLPKELTIDNWEAADGAGNGNNSKSCKYPSVEVQKQYVDEVYSYPTLYAGIELKPPPNSQTPEKPSR